MADFAVSITEAATGAETATAVGVDTAAASAADTSSAIVGYLCAQTEAASATVTDVGVGEELQGGALISYSVNANADSSSPHGVYGMGVYSFIKDVGDLAYSSSDLGVSWSSSALVQPQNWITGMAFNGVDYFVTAAYNNDQFSTSYDNLDWNNSEYGISKLWRSTRFCGGLFVVVGGTTTGCETSTDGVTWNGHTVPNATWYDVAYGNGTFVAISYAKSGSSTSDIVALSTDGTTWTSQAMGVHASNWYKIAYGNGLFVASCNGYNSLLGRTVRGVAVCTNGADWVLYEDVLYTSGDQVTFASGDAIVIKGTTPDIFVSTDGAVWTAHDPATRINPGVFIRSNGLVIAGPASIPLNNRLTEAHVISNALQLDSFDGDTTFSTAAGGETIFGGGVAADYNTVWFKWRCFGGGLAIFDTLGSGFDTTLRVYSGTAATYAALTPIGQSDDFVDVGYTTESHVSFMATAGTTYYIQVAGNATGVYGAYTLNWNIPPPVSYAVFPMPLLRLEGGTLALNTIAYTFPMLVPTIRAAARVAVTPPALTAQITGTTTILIEIDVEFPMLTASISGTRTDLLQVVGTFPSPTVELRAAARIDAALPPLQLLVSATTGSVAAVRATLPMLTASISITAQAFAVIEAALPMLVAGPFGRIVSMLPMAQISLSGHTVVSVTYEAYSVNLKHTSEKPIDETTRHTNLPFDQIVRWGNSYYGAGATGLYLFGGTTDYAGTPTKVPWVFKTAMTDDRVPQKKTVRAVRFAGRVGPAATVTIYPGEPGSTPYTYTTPRDDTVQNYRQVLGRGIKARYYALGMAGDGVLELDTFEPEVDKLTRKL